MIAYVLCIIAGVMIVYRLKAFAAVVKKLRLSSGEERKKTEEELLRERSYFSYAAIFAIIIMAFPSQIGKLIIEYPTVAFMFVLIVVVHTFYPNYMRAIKRIQKITWAIGAIILVSWVFWPATEKNLPPPAQKTIQELKVWWKTGESPSPAAPRQTRPAPVENDSRLTPQEKEAAALLRQGWPNVRIYPVVEVIAGKEPTKTDIPYHFGDAIKFTQVGEPGAFYWGGSQNKLKVTGRVQTLYAPAGTGFNGHIWLWPDENALRPVRVSITVLSRIQM